MDSICQSCARPFTGESDYGTNGDGSINREYCRVCFESGEFRDPHKTLKIAIEENISMALERGIDKELAEKMAHQIFPKLKRWNNNQN